MPGLVSPQQRMPGPPCHAPLVCPRPGAVAKSPAVGRGYTTEQPLLLHDSGTLGPSVFASQPLSPVCAHASQCLLGSWAIEPQKGLAPREAQQPMPSEMPSCPESWEKGGVTRPVTKAQVGHGRVSVTGQPVPLAGARHWQLVTNPAVTLRCEGTTHSVPTTCLAGYDLAEPFCTSLGGSEFEQSVPGSFSECCAQRLQSHVGFQTWQWGVREPVKQGPAGAIGWRRPGSRSRLEGV